MKLLHVINSVRPEGGGPIEGIKQLASVNVRNGHQVEVVSMDGASDPCVKTCPIPVHPVGPSALTYCYASRFVPWLRSHAQDYDVVVVNGIWQYQLFGTWRALRKSSTPYVVFTHGMLDPWFKKAHPAKHMKKWLYWPWGGYRPLRDARSVIFTCDEERLLARESFWLYQVNERVVNYGTAGPTGDPGSQRETFWQRFPETRGKRILLFMGRIHPKKACDLVINAFGKVMGSDPDWHLVMAGPDPTGWIPDLTAQARQAGVEHRITWAGMVSGDLKWGALRCAEAFFLPSHQENFGIAVAEALACGLPALISDKVNIWRELLNEGAGFVAPDDADGARTLLMDWVRLDEQERSQMRDRAHECFLRNFEIHNAAASLIQQLQAAAAGN